MLLYKKEENDEANDWYQVIAPIIAKGDSLPYGEKYKLMRTIAAGKYEGITLPGGKKCISIRTVERKLALYKKEGKEALKSNVRKRTARIPKEYLEKGVTLKRENMSRSIERIISILEEAKEVPKNVLKQSTVYDYFTKVKLTSPTMGNSNGKFTRYGASYRGEILQGDTHYTLKLPDPCHEGYERQVYLFIWLDDWSRLANGCFYWKERLPSLEDTLKKWLITYGSVENIYADNGSVYSSKHLMTICASLGIRLLHSRPYKPQGKGKCEKFFQIVERAFKSEVELLINQGKVITLEELNLLFAAWLNKYYNRRIHSATKQSPISRWDSSDKPVPKLSLEKIYEAFLYKDERSCSKTGIFSLYGNKYEVEKFLCNKKVEIKYDPYDLSTGIQIYFEGKRFKDAIVAKVHRHSKKGYEENNMDVEPTPTSGLNFVEQLSEKELGRKELMKFLNLPERNED